MNFDIILATHSSLCDGFIQAASLILGNTDLKLYTASFVENMSVDSYEDLLKDLIMNKCQKKDILILTDIFGGTPANEAIKALTSNKKIEIISGLNLQLLIEVIIARNNGTLLSNVDIAKMIKESREGILSVNKKIESM